MLLVEMMGRRDEMVAKFDHVSRRWAREICLSAALKNLRPIQRARYRHKYKTSKHNLVLFAPTKCVLLQATLAPEAPFLGSMVLATSSYHLVLGVSSRRLTSQRPM